jgi:lipopolysaccharide transport system permease protein
LVWKYKTLIEYLNLLKLKVENNMTTSNASDVKITTIKPKSGWQVIDFMELIEYRDLFCFLVWRDIKVMYAQTIMGFSWAILQPLIQIAIFTIIFGKIAKIPTEGIPYMLYSTVAIIPWTYLSTAMTQSSQSLVQGINMLGKVYFPRLIFPVTPVLARLIDFLISVVLILIVSLYYRVMPTWNLVFLPLFFVQMISIATGVGMWLSAMAIRFRDVKYAMPFVVRMLMYAAPIVYSASSIPAKYRIFYSLNPIVGVIEGYRACFLGTPILWIYIWPGFLTTIILLISGVLYFKRMEKIFVDVI